MSTIGSKTLLGIAVVLGSMGPAARAGGECFEFQMAGGIWDEDDAFGYAVAIDGDLAAVGAPFGATQPPQSPDHDGTAVYVFHRSPGGVWVPEATLYPDVITNTAYGSALSLSGDRLAVGARNQDANKGAVYVYRRLAPGSWTLETKLVGPDTTGGGGTKPHFGRAVAIQGDCLVVGSSDDGTATFLGVGFVYRREAHGEWEQEALLHSSESIAAEGFGRNVSLDGDRVLMGADKEGVFFPSLPRGAAYVFRRDPDGTWVEEAMLEGINPLLGGQALDSEFGAAVSLDGDVCLVGAPEDFNNLPVCCGGFHPGSAYVFRRQPDDTWVQEAWLGVPGISSNIALGYSVAVKGDFAAVGAPEDAPNGPGSGSVALFRRNVSGVWEYDGTCFPANGLPGDFFGASVALRGEYVLAGAPYRDGVGLDNIGGAWVSSNSQDCNENGMPDADDIAGGTSYDVDSDGVPDECETPWSPAGPGLPGTSGVPVLQGAGSLIPGTWVSLDLTDAKPLSPATMVIGASPLGLPFKGGVLAPFPHFLLFLTVDGFGEAHLGGSMPPSFPLGDELIFQVWIVDPAGPAGYAASNAIKVFVP